jgi:hypothetical protein
MSENVAACGSHVHVAHGRGKRFELDVKKMPIGLRSMSLFFYVSSFWSDPVIDTGR